MRVACSSKVQMRDEDGILAILGCAKEDAQSLADKSDKPLARIVCELKHFVTERYAMPQIARTMVFSVSSLWLRLPSSDVAIRLLLPAATCPKASGLGS